MVSSIKKLVLSNQDEDKERTKWGDEVLERWRDRVIIKLVFHADSGWVQQQLIAIRREVKYLFFLK